MANKKRSWEAQIAHFRNSAGFIKDKREIRGGTKNNNKEYYDLVEEENEIKQELNNIEEKEEK